MNTLEIWKIIPELQNRYEISNLGQIRSERGIRKLPVHVSGYIIVCIKINSKVRNFYIHRLVANAFIPNPENKKEVNHIDGIKSNNCCNNLDRKSTRLNSSH